jgi:hypothetical protein
MNKKIWILTKIRANQRDKFKMEIIIKMIINVKIKTLFLQTTYPKNYNRKKDKFHS